MYDGRNISEEKITIADSCPTVYNKFEKKVAMKNIMFFLLIIASCKIKTGEIKDGGSCTYSERGVPAKLISLQASEDGLFYDAWFEIDNIEDQYGATKDTIQYSRINNNPIPTNQLKEDKIETGKVYQYVEQTITSGTCSPHMWFLKLEEYKPEVK